MPSSSFSLNAQDRFLMVTQLLPGQVVTNALSVQAAYREYQAACARAQRPARACTSARSR